MQLAVKEKKTFAVVSLSIRIVIGYAQNTSKIQIKKFLFYFFFIRNTGRYTRNNSFNRNLFFKFGIDYKK